MLKDIPYNILKQDGRAYEIMLLRDQYANTFTDISRRYGISTPCVIIHYKHILSLKLQYYINHLSIVHGHDNSEYFNNLSDTAFECYQHNKYIIAYFDKEYPDILRKYREGEPSMPDNFLRSLPPLRDTFSKRTVSSIIRLREVEKLSYADIGKRLRMTKEKADSLYNHHYHVMFLALSEKIMKDTGYKDIRRKYHSMFRVGNSKKKYDSLIMDYPEYSDE